jgi:hypothetical protein
VSAVRSLALLLGLVLAVLGFAVTVVPGIADVVRFPPLPTMVPAVLAVAFGFAGALRRRHTSFRDEEDDESRNEFLEARYEPPRPGDDIDARLREGSGTRRASERTAQFSERVREVTIQTLVDTHGIRREEAEQQLTDGTWTDSKAAAAFFSDEVESPTEDFVGAVVSSDPLYEKQAAHVVRELQRLTGVDGGEA